MIRSISKSGARIVWVGMALAFSLACGETSPSAPGGPPELALSATSAAFAAVLGAPGPTLQHIELTSAGQGALVGLSAAVEYGEGAPSGWLTATLSGTAVPATLTLAASTTSTSAGLHEASVVISSAGLLEPAVVSVTLALAAGSPPSIVVTSPARAAMLEQGTFADSDVRITGEACHESAPITDLAVNGQSLAVSGTSLCEAFDVMQSSPWGLSTVTVRATNGYGRTAEVVQSFLRSPSFQTAAPDPIQAGLHVRLNQAVLDDADQDLDDVAAIVEAELSPTSTFADLPDLLHTSDVLQTNDWWNPCTDELQVFKDNLSWTGRSVGLTAGANGLATSVALVAPRFGIRVAYTGCLGNTTTVYGAIEADQLTLSGTVTVSGLTVTSEFFAQSVNPYLDLNQGGLISEVTTQLANVVFPFLQQYLEDAVSDNVGPEIGAGLEDALRSLEREASATVNGREISTRVARNLVEHATGSVRVRLDAHVQLVDAPAGPTPAFGPMLADASSQPPSLSSVGHGVGVAVSFDAINQLLWTAWRAGAFEIPDVDAYLGGAVPGLHGGISVLLPPVILPGTGAHAFDVGLGDVAFTAEVDRGLFGLPGGASGAPVAIEAFGSARLGVSLGYDDASGSIEVTAVTPIVQVQIVGSDDLLDEVAIADAVEEALASILPELIPSAIAAVPAISLELGDHAFGLAAVTIGRAGAHLTIEGDVVAR